MATYKIQRYLLMTTDPVHIGTGGYRLGGVDNTIVREPGTRIPKIPGTSLHGAARSYAAQLYETPEAAGQSQDNVQEPDKNPVCYTFGYVKKSKDGNDENTTAYSGVVNIFDARVVLFPVYSMAGPVWVSTKDRLEHARFTVNNLPESWDTESVCVTWDRREPLNLGWLMVNVAGKVTVTAPDKWEAAKRWNAVAGHIVLVQESLFAQVVNSNLEVRTSVAIDPKTGAAEEGALFTYEAIPRSAFLTLDVVLDDYRDGDPRKKMIFPSKHNMEERLKGIKEELAADDEKKKNSLEKEKAAIEKELKHIEKLKYIKKWSDPLDVVRGGLKMIEWLGVGGMGTRGFGRVAIVGEPMEKE